MSFQTIFEKYVNHFGSNPPSQIKEFMNIIWSFKNGHPISYSCGFCQRHVTAKQIMSASGSYKPKGSTNGIAYDDIAKICICSHCFSPTYFDLHGKQSPSYVDEKIFSHVPEGIYKLYKEMCRCFSIDSFNAAAMLGRKLLMNIAHNLGAKDGLSFQKYIEYLTENNYISNAMKGWVDKIRVIGNESNHEIPDINNQDAVVVVQFVNLLLDIIYEAPKKAGLV